MWCIFSEHLFLRTPLDGCFDSSTLANLFNNYFINITSKIAEKFHSKEVSPEEVKKVIKSLNKKKSAISSCIPVKVLIEPADTYLPIFTDIINSSIRNGAFPEELKLAEATPLFKKADPFDKVNYRPVTVLSHFSKVYERIISVPKVPFNFMIN